MKTFRGVDLTTMPAFVKTPKEGRVLLLDGDAAAYRAAATVAKLPTAVNKFWTLVLEEMYVTEASQAIVHLTSHDCTKLNRKFYPTAKPYQGNRVGKVKPPLLEPLREGLVRETAPDGIAVVLNREMEADDAIISMAYDFSDVVISSADKDLRQTIHPYFESETGQVVQIPSTDGWVDIKHTPSGVAKLTGHGWFFLLAQWLAGDPADNVAGLLSYKGSKVGVVKAVKLLHEWGDFNESVHNIIKAYARIKQDALAVKHSFIALGTSQFSVDGIVSTYPTIENLKDSKVGVQGAIETMIFMGKNNDESMSKIRYFSCPKVKRARTGASDLRFQAYFDTDRCRFKDGDN